jgi:hypothetical protein
MGTGWRANRNQVEISYSAGHRLLPPSTMYSVENTRREALIRTMAIRVINRNERH